jgi:L-threonylcarbamoyladenylate synthase
VDPDHPDATVLDAAAAVLRDGGIVALPTETTYGLAADPRNRQSIERLFRLKRRPADRPVGLLISDPDHLAGIVVAPRPDLVADLAAAFWPGPLTLVLPVGPDRMAPGVSPAGTIAVRISSHPVARAVAERFGGAITATSANPSGCPACVDAAAVVAAFPSGIDLVLDGGAAPGGPPSTLLDLTVRPPRVLRDGAVSRRRLQRWLEERSG